MDLRREILGTDWLINQIANGGIKLLWRLGHLIVSLWYFGVDIANAFESCLITAGLLDRYKALDGGKVRYLAIAVESEDSRDLSKIIRLLLWLASMGVKHLCLFDSEGVLKKSKEAIMEKLRSEIAFEDTDDEDLLLDREHKTLEFVSASDGKESIAKAANLLFKKYTMSPNTSAEVEEKVFTESFINESLKAVGCHRQDPDLLLVYGPVRCHLGFPAWRMRYTEIVHMGPLKSMRYGMLVKAIYKFTLVQQNYGK